MHQRTTSIRFSALVATTVLTLVMACSSRPPVDPKVAGFRQCIEGRERTSNSSTTLSASVAGTGASVGSTQAAVDRAYPMSDANERQIIDACRPLLGVASAGDSLHNPRVEIGSNDLNGQCGDGGLINAECSVQNYEPNPVAVDLVMSCRTGTIGTSGSGVVQRVVLAPREGRRVTAFAQLTSFASTVFKCSSAKCRCWGQNAQWQPQ